MKKFGLLKSKNTCQTCGVQVCDKCICKAKNNSPKGEKSQKICSACNAKAENSGIIDFYKSLEFQKLKEIQDLDRAIHETTL